MRCNNLPSQLSTFIGREREIATATRLLHTTRLLTLTGPGGSGKTRLALAVAVGLLRRYPEGVWFVELSSLSDPDLLPQAVAAALGYRPLPGRPVVAGLAAHLTSKHILLLLDNCEHLVAACADLVFKLLTAAPSLRILATSREPLHVTGETTWPVPPMAVPELDVQPPLEQLARVEAVRLFVDRATRIVPTFALAEQNALPVSRICRRLAGSPLAIELAAARTRVLSPAQIADRLEDALGLLATDNRTVPVRHRTLQATLDWSYNLLSDGERALFRRLSVFADSFSLEAAEALGRPDEHGHGEDAAPVSHILELLSGLVDKSLLEVEGEVGLARRFRYLEPVRQYAASRLAQSGDEPDTWRRLLTWAVELAERLGPATYSLAAKESVDLLEVEHANLRAALAWALSEPRCAIERRRLAAALTQFWQVRGYIGEGMAWFEQILDAEDEVPVRSQIETFGAAAFIAMHGYDFARGRRYLEQGIRLAEGLDDRYWLAELHQRMCFLAFGEGDLLEAERLCNLTLPMFDERGDQWGRAVILFYQANIDYLRLDYPRAKETALESLEISRELGYTPALARREIRLGQICHAQGDLVEAKTRITDGLRTSRETGDNWGIAMGLAALAGLERQEGRPERAAWLLGAAQHLRDAFGAPLWIVDEIEYDRNRTELLSLLGQRGFSQMSESGAHEALDDLQAALRKALDEPVQAEPQKKAPAGPSALLRPTSVTSSPLSRREREVAALIAQGKSNAEIAAGLFVGLRTVEAHVTHILNKLGFNSRAQIAAWVAGQSASAASDTPHHPPRAA